MILTDSNSEKALLASILHHGFDAFVEADDLVTVNSFGISTHSIIYSCFKRVFSESRDTKLDFPLILATAHSMGFEGFNTNKVEFDLLHNLSQIRVDLSNTRATAKKLRNLEITRSMRDQLKEIDSKLCEVKGNESLSSILSIVENPVFDFSNLLIQNEAGTSKLGQDLNEYVEYLLNNPKEIIGVSTGFTRFDAGIGGGLRRKTLNLIAARVKVGKSICGDNIAVHVCKNLKIPVLMLDSEMSKIDHWNRILANLSNIPISDIEHGRFSSKPILKSDFLKASRHLESIPYYYHNVAGLDFEEIIALMRRWTLKEVGQGNDCLIIFDYLKLMNEKGLDRMAEWQKIGFMSTALTNFAIKYDLPILAFTQTNRDGITKETADIVSQSDRLTWFSANVSLFKTKTEEEIGNDGRENGNRKLLILMARHGEGLPDGDYINMNMQGNLGRITELKTRNELHRDKAVRKDSTKTVSGDSIQF